MGTTYHRTVRPKNLTDLEESSKNTEQITIQFYFLLIKAI